MPIKLLKKSTLLRTEEDVSLDKSLKPTATEISVLNIDDDNADNFLLKPPKNGVSKFFEPPIEGPSTAWGPSSP